MDFDFRRKKSGAQDLLFDPEQNVMAGSVLVIAKNVILRDFTDEIGFHHCDGSSG